jgi:parallel beta-helix repeat protein
LPGADGSAAQPFATVQQLVDALGAGQTGCLEPGTYDGPVAFHHGGSPGLPLTLTSAPGTRATLSGRVYVPVGSDDVTISGLNLDGANPDTLPSPELNASRTTLSDDDITNDRTGICLELGSHGWGQAVDDLITRNRIHGCGELPATNYQHGIYVEWSRRSRIIGNWIYDNADRGIQLYDDAQQTTIAGNVIDGNGEGVIFSGDDGYASSDNIVTNNVIADARVRDDVESWWPAGNPIGSGNLVTANCLWGGRETIGEELGFVAIGNLIRLPGFIDAAAADYRLVPTSPCAPLLAGQPAPTFGLSAAAGSLAGKATAAPRHPRASSLRRGRHRHRHRARRHRRRPQHRHPGHRHPGRTLRRPREASRR